ncbi:MAG TPA: DUF2269 domain-containing protein [Gammaproteobacteria bacterium]|nr:DUF2269 domain-containing protein [Gammaproteobacteria bacterium]
MIHIISATLIFGTGLGSAFYLYRAHLSKDNRAIAFAARNVVIADWMFTTPAVIIQPITGVWLMYVMSYTWQTPWILIALGLFVLVGVCWLPVVWIQIKIRQLAEQSLQTGDLLCENPIYKRYIKIWFALGWPAFSAVIVIFYLMVFKPNY